MVLFTQSFIRKRVISLATTSFVMATSFALAQDPPGTHHVHGGMPLLNAAGLAGSEEQPFLSANETAMNKMMADMTIKPSGDVDRDFVAMMVPHHQGAVDMAQAELRYGHNEQLRRIAQEIVVTQLQEIPAMRLAVGEKLPPSMASPTQATPMTSSMVPGSAMSHDSTARDSMKMKQE
jgi:uncharacterized protein (DUF305 family)